jgi:hypothetical protein
MRRLHYLLLCVLLLAGCRPDEPVPHSTGSAPAGPDRAVAELNRQIEAFNAQRRADKGISPLDQRVSRVEYASGDATVNCFDAQGTMFLVLTRQPDGGFKGSLKTTYHELVNPERHAWGEVEVVLTLPRQ